MVKREFAVILASFLAAAFFSFSGAGVLLAQTRTSKPTPTPTVTPIPTQTPRPVLTEETPETLGPLEKILDEQELGPILPFNPIKYAIRNSIDSGVSANTIVLLLLLPLVAAIIAGVRHLVGLRGFGIFLPAALSVVFVATGPLLGIGLFLVIVTVSTSVRIFLRRAKIRLQYLPRMALLLWAVSFSMLLVLFAAPFFGGLGIANVSIFPILILALLAEDFSRVQLGKSARAAINIATETLILALVSYIFLTLKPVQEFALLKPEILILSVVAFDFILGRYVGLRFIEFWKFRKLIIG